MTAPRAWTARSFGPAPLLCMAALASCGASEAVRRQAESQPPPEPACLYSTADLTAPPERRRYLCLSSKRREAGGVGPPLLAPASLAQPPQEAAAPLPQTPPPPKDAVPLLQTWPPPKAAMPAPQTWPAWAPEPGLPPPQAPAPPPQAFAAPQSAAARPGQGRPESPGRDGMAGLKEGRPNNYGGAGAYAKAPAEQGPRPNVAVRGAGLRGGSLYISGQDDSLLAVAGRLLDAQLAPSLGAGELAAAIWLLSGHCLAPASQASQASRAFPASQAPQASGGALQAHGGGAPFGALRPGCRLRLPAQVPASLRPHLARLWQLLQAVRPQWQSICRLAQQLAPGRTPAPSWPCAGGQGGVAW